VAINSPGSRYSAHVTAVRAGSFDVTLHNWGAIDHAVSVQINFVVIKGSTT
jgi:hypothetical protein